MKMEDAKKMTPFQVEMLLLLNSIYAELKLMNSEITRE